VLFVDLLARCCFFRKRGFATVWAVGILDGHVSGRSG
jgi:hypothetical protein